MELGVKITLYMEKMCVKFFYRVNSYLKIKGRVFIGEKISWEGSQKYRKWETKY